MSLSIKEAFELYENGKSRRYSHLFTVNGGAFAIAKLLAGESGEPGQILGKLTLSGLSFGMILFTIIMTYDLFAFGLKMRNNYQLSDAFELPGKIVLILVGALICAGWFLAGLA